VSDFWFTADWHLGHQRIIELSHRPFRDLDDMHRQLIERHNDVVRPNDTVWVIGDVCMGSISESLALVSRFHGVKRLVAGNHDRCFAGHRDAYGPRRPTDVDPVKEWTQRYMAAGFASVLNGDHVRRVGFGALVQLRAAERTARGKLIERELNVELCHFPIAGESDAERPDRFAEYRPRKLDGTDRNKINRWVVHGHVHDAWLTNGRNVNVGVDAWDYGPVRQDELARLITSIEAEPNAQSALDGEHGALTYPIIPHTGELAAHQRLRVALRAGTFAQNGDERATDQ
jgi:calcineurin-like phosphoesterase family protein